MTMAVSKRTRFEVLRRDDHTCQYCGESAPTVTLHVDHVIPTTLGGSDKPDNLVAACKDCNLGKSSTSPAGEFVQGLSAKADAYAEHLAIEAIKHVAAATKLRSNYERFEAFYEAFSVAWENSGFSIHIIGKASLFRWWLMGVPELFMLDIVDDMGGRRGAPDEPFRYFASVIWGSIKSQSVELDDTEALNPPVYTQEELDTADQRSFCLGMEVGYAKRIAGQVSSNGS